MLRLTSRLLRACKDDIWRTGHAIGGWRISADAGTGWHPARRVAQDSTNGHSPFAEALAKTIREPGLDIFQTFNEVGLIVKRATGGSQQPWVSSSPIDGKFYFVAPLASPGPQAAVTPPPRVAETLRPEPTGSRSRILCCCAN